MDSEQQTDRPNEKGSQEFTPAVAFAMGEIKGTVENLRTDLKEWKNDIRESITTGDSALNVKAADLEKRVRSLEQWKWTIAGAAAAGGLAGGKLMDLLIKVTQ